VLGMINRNRGHFPTGQHRNLAFLEDALRGVHLSDPERTALVALARR